MLKLFVIFATLSVASEALAIQECEAKGKYINLSNGNSTKGLTATVVCKEKDNGKIQREEKYVNGVVTFVRYFSYEGKLKSECGRNPTGNRQGLCKEWHDNGKLAREENYVNGRNIGMQKYFAVSGAVERIANQVSDNDKTEISFNEDGSIERLECGSAAVTKSDRDMCGFNGKVSVVKFYVKKGQPFQELSYLKGKVVATKKINIETGKVEATDQFAAAGKDGVRLEKFPNGKMKTETRYDQDKQMNGLQKEFAESGQVTREALFAKGFMTREKLFYLNGQLKRLTEKTKQKDQVFVASKEYWDNGTLRRSGTFREVREQRSFGFGSYWSYEDLREEGKFQDFREDGSLAEETFWKDGELQGVSKRFFADGKKLERENTYEGGKLMRTKEYAENGKLIAHEEFFADGSKKSHLKKKAK